MQGEAVLAPFVHATSELPEKTSSIATIDLVDWLAERVIMPKASRASRRLSAAYLRELSPSKASMCIGCGLGVSPGHGRTQEPAPHGDPDRPENRASADHRPSSCSSALRRSRASRCISSTMWSPRASVSSASRIWEM